VFNIGFNTEMVAVFLEKATAFPFDLEKTIVDASIAAPL
jgi:hypothetical protein